MGEPVRYLDNHHIGWVVWRSGRANQRVHLVESAVAGAAVTKCGRRMEAFDSRKRSLLTRDDGDVTCFYCQ